MSARFLSESIGFCGRYDKRILVCFRSTVYISLAAVDVHVVVVVVVDNEKAVQQVIVQ